MGLGEDDVQQVWFYILIDVMESLFLEDYFYLYFFISDYWSVMLGGGLMLYEFYLFVVSLEQFLNMFKDLFRKGFQEMGCSNSFRDIMIELFFYVDVIFFFYLVDDLNGSVCDLGVYVFFLFILFLLFFEIL